ncbi:hypothetical protein OAH76_04585 [Verrucomicrobia bacterium]|nr:hypothetical protein [Verrucomicrobiota bacterium]MDA7682486.1 hypothetical protein [bacterium]MDB4705100.1 hypothetical protein [Verrucomicrobiota bacterium]MDB4744110.1 hypothetical protein [Verrucomicrobiota bacterium]MDB4804121.1 hypothetical protein [Verrucomicrobiota bacterium]
MDQELQSVLALGIVATTALAFLLRYFLKRRSGACSEGCGCDLSEKTPNQIHR